MIGNYPNLKQLHDRLYVRNDSIHNRHINEQLDQIIFSHGGMCICEACSIKRIYHNLLTDLRMSRRPIVGELFYVSDMPDVYGGIISIDKIISKSSLKDKIYLIETDSIPDVKYNYFELLKEQENLESKFGFKRAFRKYDSTPTV